MYRTGVARALFESEGAGVRARFIEGEMMLCFFKRGEIWIGENGDVRFGVERVEKLRRFLSEKRTRG